VVLRFHKTKIVRIRPNGDMMLTSGGWYTATTGVQMQRAHTLQCAMGRSWLYTGILTAHWHGSANAWHQPLCAVLQPTGYTPNGLLY
jgi:hypothetical protein